VFQSLFGNLTFKQRLLVWLLLGPSAGLVAWRPESATVSKLLGSSLGTLFVIASVLLVWQWRRIRMVAILVVALIAAAIFAPGREFDREALRAAYVDSLRAYENVPYVWGGEGRRGVDCSGLVRCGLMNACVKRGVLTANPALIRMAASIWWNDSSAKAMGEGWKGFTVPFGESKSPNATRTEKIKPGDLAVTTNGLHILVFLGGKQWMQAAPEVGHAALFEAPSDNEWMKQSIKLVRWKALAD
jgi:hypothetical protein